MAGFDEVVVDFANLEVAVIAENIENGGFGAALGRYNPSFEGFWDIESSADYSEAEDNG